MGERERQEREGKGETGERRVDLLFYWVLDS